MEISPIFGYLAAIFTTISYVPQAVQIIRSKHTKDISLLMYTILNAGIISWLIYGWLINDWPIIIANSITIVFTATILILKLRYK
ncbi:MAG: SemiSWEET transporter [Bacteroidia bacterium]|jgi:MtN3 and saliva related transmembrane protein|nr:SemiSWEET transporter [Bacteroidia bacterium]MCC6768418.1 SemiSWEET transporter [Bacteroidia bacterium]